ncbi:hypothetical protein [Acidovorax sp.]|uniref:hypothetical protein n=1 Tax=Acidovorax sp. TaxID=1872122 RepID=UPI0025C0E9FC|nr:hypothetical protein [Acidovorax sp.]MBW8463509.1 hypothetical protein [Acidovorax sp.]
MKKFASQNSKNLLVQAALLAGLASSALFVQGCASPSNRITRTQSGYPEITINSVDVRAIRSNLVARNAAGGWTIETETENMLLMTRVSNPLETSSVIAQAMLGNSRSTTPKAEARYIITLSKNQTLVVVQPSISTQMAGGQINRMDLKDNNDVFNNFQNQLARVKTEIEAN